MSEPGKRGGVCPAGQDARVCADCGATDDLYFHERDGEWACEEVADCIERQREQERAERDRYRAETVRLREQLRYAIDALEGRPWTGWNTDAAKDALDA